MSAPAEQEAATSVESLHEALAHIERAGELLPGHQEHLCFYTRQLANQLRKALQAQGVQLEDHHAGLTAEREAIEGAVTILHSGESTGDLDGAVDQVLESLESVLEAG